MKCTNVFTSIDHAIIRAAVKSLPVLHGTVIELRFWENMDAIEIAQILGLSIQSTETLLVRAMRMLREYCLRHPAFSRSKHSMLKIMESNSVA
jgi:DNA-directed RNA polymerase specialized sigma24 family protein